MSPTYHFVEGAPKQNANYSHATEVGGLFFLTGQLATDTNPAHSFPDGIEAQTRKTLQNLQHVLRGLGLSFEDVVFIRIFLLDMDRDYAGMNAIYNHYFSLPDCAPGRTTLGVSQLARGALIEIDLIASKAK
jgi:2-iminobutanoate/2-iminopropanoate deaminase